MRITHPFTGWLEDTRDHSHERDSQARRKTLAKRLTGRRYSITKPATVTIAAVIRILFPVSSRLMNKVVC